MEDWSPKKERVITNQVAWNHKQRQKKARLCSAKNLEKSTEPGLNFLEYQTSNQHQHPVPVEKLIQNKKKVKLKVGTSKLFLIYLFSIKFEFI